MTYLKFFHFFRDCAYGNGLIDHFPDLLNDLQIDITNIDKICD